MGLKNEKSERSIMNIQDALKSTGRAVLILDGEKVEYVKWFNDTLWWVNIRSGACDREVRHLDILEGDWEPYHEVEEIRPEKVGELWQRDGEINHRCVTYEGIVGLNVIWWGGTANTNRVDKDMIHNKNGWKRVWPNVEDENVERIEIEGVKWEEIQSLSGTQIVTLFWTEQGFSHIKRQWLNKSPMKMTLEIPKDNG